MVASVMNDTLRVAEVARKMADCLRQLDEMGVDLAAAQLSAALDTLCREFNTPLKPSISE